MRHTPARWYVQLTPEACLPAFSAPEDVLGDDLFNRLPDGDTGRRWRALLTEVQVLLHQHAWNVERVARGKQMINSLWFWGAGVLPHTVMTPHRQVRSRDVLLHALAKASGSDTDSLHMVDALVDLRHLCSLTQFSDEVVAPLLAAMGRGELKQLVLDFRDGEIFTHDPCAPLAFLVWCAYSAGRLSVPKIIRRLSLPLVVWPDNVPPLLRRVYTARGCADPVTAQPCLAQLLSPAMLSNMQAATVLLTEVIKANGRILVVGDFDCDGATACAVAVRGLRLLGARNVMHAVPNRMVHGYGLSSALVEELAPLQPALLVTVDHGIACHAGIAAAKARGWKVLVTDHHLPGEILPPADVIVNPNLPGDLFPSKTLAGVGVIFYVLLALRARLYPAARAACKGQETRIHSSISQKNRPDLTSLLDLVAVGTVADLVPLDTNNRALVAAGLRRLRRGQGCLGTTRVDRGQWP